MGRWATSQFSEVLQRTRIDAEYHSHEARGLESKLLGAGLRLHPLRNVCHNITSGHTPLRHDLSKGDIYFVTVERVSPLNVDFSGDKRVTHCHYDGELRRVALKPSSVVVTIKRRIAQASPCYHLQRKAVVNQDVAVLELKTGWAPGFVAAYLNCSFAQRLADRERTEQMNPYLPVGKLGGLLVPEISADGQLEVDRTVIRRFELLNEANDLYRQAQQLLESELGLDKLTFSNPVGYTSTLSVIEAERRLDGDYFQPKYQALRDAITSYNHGFEIILQVADALKPNIDPSQAPTNDFNYVELSQINSALGMIEGHTESSGAGLPSRARRQVSAGDVIASAVVGSVDKVALISPAEDGYIASTGFFHFRPKTVSPEYLLMLVRSRCVSMQFQQQATGGILSAVPDSRLKYVIVPRFPQQLQDKVTDLVAQAHQAKRESDALLEKAKDRVEQLIEEAIEQ